MKRILCSIAAAGLCIAALALSVIGLAAPSPSSSPLQLWPDRGVGVTCVLLEDMPDHADPQILAWGVHRTAEGQVARARTYLHFPLDVFPPGSDILRATLYVYADAASDTGEATFGAYRVLEPWAGRDWSGDPAGWPALLTTPIAVTEAHFDVVTPTLAATDAGAPFSRPAGHGLLQDTTVSVVLSDTEVALGATTVVSVRVENVTDLYSAEVELTFDPALLEVVDADLDTGGVQIQPGGFLSPSIVVKNIVDQDAGEINFAAFQLDPSEPISGSGTLATITFWGQAAGTCELHFEDVSLEEYGGGFIAASVRGGSITVVARETPTATVTPTPPASPLPTPAASPAGSGRPVALQQGAGTWLTWNVTALMRAWLAGEATNHGLALAPAPDPDADPETAGDLLVAHWLAADDPTTRPYLIVEFEVHPVTPTPTPTPVPVLPPAGGAVGWGPVGLLFAGVVLLALGLTAQRR